MTFNALKLVLFPNIGFIVHLPNIVVLYYWEGTVAAAVN